MKKISIAGCRLPILVLLVAILSGCASRGQIVTDYHNPHDPATEIDLLIEPVDAIGVLETPALREGKASFYECVFPQILFYGEMSLGKLKWFGWAVNGGKEYLAQLIYIYKTSLTGKLIGGLMIDGTEAELSGGKVVGLSARFDYLYGLDINEMETAVAEKKSDLLSSRKARREYVEKNGMEISKLPKADYLYDMINNWNRYETTRGPILSPLTEEQFKKVARENPAYSYTQKLVKNMKGNITPDPIALGMSGSFDLITAIGADSAGGDFNSLERRRFIAIIYMSIDPKQNAIDQLNNRLQEQKYEKKGEPR